MGLGLATTPNVAANATVDQTAVVTVKRRKPRPTVQSSRAFLAAQQDKAAVDSTAAASPVAVIKPPKEEKPGIKAWELNPRNL
jgi:hypothetical protein